MSEPTQRFYEAYVELLRAGDSPVLFSAAVEYCLAFRDWRECSRRGPDDRPYGWVNRLNELQDRMDKAWNVFEREVNKRADDLAALNTPPQSSGPELFSKPKRRK